MEKSKVYFTKEITPEGLVRIYEALNIELKGKVAVKISTGEAGGHNYLKPELIGKLVKKLNGTIVECNTAYAGKRNTVEDHMEVVRDHGFLTIADVDIMDADGEIEIPVAYNGHLKGKNIVGSHLSNYDSMLILSHGKGHQMAGAGFCLKNMAIGVASRNGKAWIHSAGYTDDPDILWSNLPKQDDFLESMAEACQRVIDYIKKENLAYITVLNNISIDCDCDSNPKEPEMADIGILASLDPVAIDQAAYDMIINSPDEGKKSLVARMEKQHAIHTIEAACDLGLGLREYEIEEI